MSHGIGLIVGKGEKSLFNAECFINLLRLLVEGEHGFSHGIVLHFDIRPLDAVSKPPSDGLEEGLFCRESDGKALGRPGLISFFVKTRPRKKSPRRAIKRSIRSMFTISIPVPMITFIQKGSGIQGFKRLSEIFSLDSWDPRLLGPFH
jgi:hypothetical protein